MFDMFVLMLMLVLGPAPAAMAAPGPGPSEVTPGGNVYRSAGRVALGEPVQGDLIAAGGRVLAEQPVSRDAMVAGGDVAIRAPVGEDLRAAGGQVVVDAAIGGEARLAAGHVSIGRAGRIGRAAWIAAGDVEVLGHLPGDSEIHAGHAVIDGEVDGDLLVRAEALELRPGTRIRGTLTYASARPLVRDPAAQVGSVVQEPVPAQERARRGMGPGLLGGVVWLLGLAAAATIWTLLFPGLADSARARLLKAPGISLALGAAVLLVAPMLILLLLVTLVGAPLAFLLAAAYGLLLLAGYLVVASALGDRLLRALGRTEQPTIGRRLLASVLAVVLLGLLAILPMFGWLITLVVLTAGTGALVSRFPRAPVAATS
jgi:hypothetical protein